MAIYIKPIPTLTGKVAEKFEKIARENQKKRGTVDFSREVEMTKRILEKSNLRKFKQWVHLSKIIANLLNGADL